MEMKRVYSEGGAEVQVAQVTRREGIRALRDEALRMVGEGIPSLDGALRTLISEPSGNSRSRPASKGLRRASFPGNQLSSEHGLA